MHCWSGSYQVLQDHPSKLRCPDVLSLVLSETGVVHRIAFSFRDFLFTYGLFIHFILDIK